MPGHGHQGGDPFEGQPGFGGGWGVRRPLRFLAHKLDLDQKQIAELARILDELKIERAQAEVDDRRARAELADAILGATFDAGKAAAAAPVTLDPARLVDPVVHGNLLSILHKATVDSDTHGRNFLRILEDEIAEDAIVEDGQAV